MKDRRVHRVVTVCVLAAMAAGIAGGISPATASAHGVKARQVTEKMLKTQPDKNYKIQKQSVSYTHLTLPTIPDV